MYETWTSSNDVTDSLGHSKLGGRTIGFVAAAMMSGNMADGRTRTLFFLFYGYGIHYHFLIQFLHLTV